MTYGYPNNAPPGFTSLDALQAIRTPSLRGYLVDKSVPFDAVDLGMGEVLPKGPKDRAEFNLLVGDGVVRMVYRAAMARWYQIGAPPVVTTLPTDPVEGMLVSYVADDTNGVEWLLRYDSTEATYKWHYIGGPPLRGAQTADQNIGATGTYTDATSTNPKVTLPLAGTYDVRFGGRMHHDTAGGYMFMAVKNGTAASADAEALLFQVPATHNEMKSYSRRLTATDGAGTLLKAQYRNGSGVGVVQILGIAVVSSEPGFIEATPVRVV